VWLTENSREPYRLEDGSSIALEPGGRGRLTSEHGATRFDLHQGLGHFSVAKHPRQNWTVVAGQYEIHVVGTRFSVSYTAPNDLSVSVEQGRVAVRVPERADRVLLQAGDRLSTNQSQLVLQHVAGAEHAGETRLTVNPAAKASQSGSVHAPLSVANAPRTQAISSSQERAPRQDWHSLYRKGLYAEALRAAELDGFNALTQSLSAERLINLADVARLGGNSAAALRALVALERRFPGSAAAADAGFLIGRLHATRGESEAAIARFQSYLKRGEGARYSAETLGRLMELEAAKGNAKAARAAAIRYRQAAPKGPYRHLADSILDQD
jgi:TolA-binding protein